MVNVFIAEPAPRSLMDQVAGIIEARGDAGMYPEVSTNSAKVRPGAEAFHVSVFVTRPNGNRCVVARHHFDTEGEAMAYAEKVEGGLYGAAVGYCGTKHDCFEAAV